jgi:hypothetical protein
MNYSVPGRPSYSVLFTKYYSRYKINKNAMGRACSTLRERRGAFRALGDEM